MLTTTEMMTPAKTPLSEMLHVLTLKDRRTASPRPPSRHGVWWRTGSLHSESSLQRPVESRTSSSWLRLPSWGSSAASSSWSGENILVRKKYFLKVPGHHSNEHTCERLR